jgi:hypothetical protein
MAHVLDEISRVTDSELVCRLERLVRADRRLSARLIVHLGELHERKLYRGRGYSSTFDYCQSALGMSEAEAYLRIQAAKVGRRFPLVLELLGEGGVNLTAIKLLAPHLTEDNHAQLLERVRGKKKRAIEALVAQLSPKPDVPERSRKLPNTRSPIAELMLASQGTAVAATPQPMHAPPSPQSLASQATPIETLTSPTLSAASLSTLAAAASSPSTLASKQSTRWSTAASSSASSSTLALPLARSQAVPAATTLSPTLTAAVSPTFAVQSPRSRASTVALSPGRFKLELTLGQAAHDQLQQLRELLRHQNPSGISRASSSGR